jgi:ADP-ribosylglycohydrolase
MSTASITHEHPIPFAAAAAAVAAVAFLAIGAVVESHGSTPSSPAYHSTTQEGPGFDRSYFDVPSTGGHLEVGP